MLAVSAIVRHAIDPRALEEQVRTGGCGGIVTFLGVVRESAGNGRAVRGLSYEAHEEMALTQFAAIADELEQRFGEVRLGVIHRLGELAVGEIAVAVCVATPHRAQAFEACQYAIDQLKARAPIWKKEGYTDGGGDWIENCP